MTGAATTADAHPIDANIHPIVVGTTTTAGVIITAAVIIHPTEAAHRRRVTTAIKVNSARPSTQLMTHCGGGTCGRQLRRRSMNLAA